MKKILLLIIFFSFSIVLAQRGIVVCTQTPCSWQDFAQTIDNLIKTVVEIAFWIAFLIVAIGAFFIMFGGPKPDWVKKGHSMIWTTIIAYALILFSGVIFDIILEFFAPQFKTTSYFGSKIVLADTLEPGTFYNPLRDALKSSLKCGESPKKITGIDSLDRLLACIFEVIGLLKNVALILLALAIIISAGYIISAPLFGFKQISKAWQILKWSIIGFVIILLADIIQAQIERIVEPR
jgi:hypothetical protein